MAKLSSVVPLALQPGVKGEDFVKFWIEEYARSVSAWGGNPTFSVESRDQIVQVDGDLTEEGKRLLEPDFQVLNQKLDTFVTGWPYTDYIELGH